MSLTTIHVKYGGECDCGRDVMATVQTHPNGKDGAVWVRCAECREIGRYDMSDEQIT